MEPPPTVAESELIPSRLLIKTHGEDVPLAHLTKQLFKKIFSNRNFFYFFADFFNFNKAPSGSGDHNPRS
ncbi:MAG TPA: hypothetical protein DD706_13665 [Nitrospiraceae bacterium]|nr:hypothetical protein [Nitrospiraceae bacterium]